MKTLKKTRRIQIVILTALALAAGAGLFSYALRDGISFFRAPTELLAAPPGPEEVFRLGGLVEEGSLKEEAGETITFRITDGAQSVPVRYTGTRPALFAEGKGTVATGQWNGTLFLASEILAKHDEDYMPAEVIDALKAQGTYVPPSGN